MDFIERNDQFSENLMLADDQGNRITYGEFEKIYEERSKFLEEGRLAFLYCRNTVGAVLYYRICPTGIFLMVFTTIPSPARQKNLPRSH